MTLKVEILKKTHKNGSKHKRKCQTELSDLQ